MLRCANGKGGLSFANYEWLCVLRLDLILVVRSKRPPNGHVVKLKNVAEGDVATSSKSNRLRVGFTLPLSILSGEDAPVPRSADATHRMYYRGEV